MDEIVEMWLEPFFHYRNKFKTTLKELLTNLDEGGCVEEAAKIREMELEELMSFMEV